MPQRGVLLFKLKQMNAKRPENMYFLNRLLDSPFEGKRIWKFVLVNFIIATCVVLSFCPDCFFSIEKIAGVWDDWLYSFLISMLLSGGITVIIQFSDQRLPWLEKPVRRLLFDLIAVVLYSYVVSFTLGTIFSVWVWDYFTWDTIDWAAISQSTILPTLIALGLTIFFTCRAFLVEWKQAAIKSEKMENERLAGKYQGLKDQLNPHFLFNSLNVLSNLVYEDPNQANAFIEKLAHIYRYVLEVQNEEIVSLDQELEFAKSYFELQSLRFGDKFNFSIEVDSGSDLGLPPLTLQLLLENALKHNRLTTAEPLSIFVIQDGNMLTVRNNLQRRTTSAEGAGIGLVNINERYGYLTDQSVEVSQTAQFFDVRVPLLPLNDIE